MKTFSLRYNAMKKLLILFRDFYEDLLLQYFIHSIIYAKFPDFHFSYFLFVCLTELLKLNSPDDALILMKNYANIRYVHISIKDA